jgi:hypothetical protein
MALRGTIVLALLPAVAGAQSLGEAARKEKERRKQLEAAGVKPRELTDKDLRSGKGTLANEPGTTEVSDAPPPQASTADPEDVSRKRAEIEWRGRVAQARARVEANRRRYEYLNGLALIPGQRVVDDDGKPVICSVEMLRGMIANAKARWEAAEKHLENLQESARRQNVPPGWLR